MPPGPQGAAPTAARVRRPGPRVAWPGARPLRRPTALFLLLSLTLLSACISGTREQELGDQMAAEINRHLPLVHDPLLRAYVTRMGLVLAAVSERPGLKYRFHIINSDIVNAFALPGGHIYITRGLIERTRSGPELAGVLAHEIGHVAARHGVQKLERHLRTGSLVSLMYQLILGGEPDLLRQRGLDMAGMLWNASHSREDEEEADRLAVEYLVEAGIDPQGIISLLETLLAEERGSALPAAEWFSTHPMTSDRIRVVQEEIGEELEETTPEFDLKMRSYPAFLQRVAELPSPAPPIGGAPR